MSTAFRRLRKDGKLKVVILRNIQPLKLFFFFKLRKKTLTHTRDRYDNNHPRSIPLKLQLRVVTWCPGAVKGETDNENLSSCKILANGWQVYGRRPQKHDDTERHPQRKRQRWVRHGNARNDDDRVGMQVPHTSAFVDGRPSSSPIVWWRHTVATAAAVVAATVLLTPTRPRRLRSRRTGRTSRGRLRYGVFYLYKTVVKMVIHNNNTI